MTDHRAGRAAVHAALGDEHRLAIVDELNRSDRSPTELGRLLGLPSNLLAHHLDVLDSVGLIERVTSTGDRRRRYVRLRRAPLEQLAPTSVRPRGPVLFVCTHNAARSQLAAALWRRRTGGVAGSAGTRPADRVHPGAVAAGRRAGLDLTGATPRLLDRLPVADVVITVCDRAHEELDTGPLWRHWSVPDPVEAGTDRAFDAVVADLEHRMAGLQPTPPSASGKGSP